MIDGSKQKHYWKTGGKSAGILSKRVRWEFYKRGSGWGFLIKEGSEEGKASNRKRMGMGIGRGKGILGQGLWDISLTHNCGPPFTERGA